MFRTSDRGGAGRQSGDSRRTALAFRCGEPEAVERVRQYVRRILTFRGLQLSPDDIPDLEQKVMTQLWQATMRQGFDPRGGFWGFVETVTARRCIDALRRARPTTELPASLADGAPGPLETILSKERAHLARIAFGRLGASCRELIELHTVQRLTYREIASILGRKEGALRVQMHRCIEAARRLVAESGRSKAK